MSETPQQPSFDELPSVSEATETELSVTHSQDGLETDLSTETGSGSGDEVQIAIAAANVAEAYRSEQRTGQPLTKSASDPRLGGGVSGDITLGRADEVSKNIVEAFESNHFVKDAPRFEDIADDPTRTNIFNYKKIIGIGYAMTEYGGLQNLKGFLNDKIADPACKAENREALADIRENLTFIGEKEYVEAVAGLAVLWKDYLGEHPDNILYVPTETTESIGHGSRKSDRYLFERIVSTFTDEELDQYKGRIVPNVDNVQSPPERTKIVLPDDWTIAGFQMRRAAQNTILKVGDEYLDCIEINLLTADSERVANGMSFEMKYGDDKKYNIPIKAYYKAHDALDVRITGVRSTVDFGFKYAMAQAVDGLDGKKGGAHLEAVPLANIKRIYKKGKPLITIQPDGTIARQKMDRKEARSKL
jgi:hypothetical protein